MKTLRDSMELNTSIFNSLKIYGVGRRMLDDILFASDKPPPRLGIYDLDDENLCHELIKTTCNVPGCVFTADTLLEYESHYNASHRYVCSQCKKMLPSPHLLDIHIQETHDSFFAVMSERKPSFCCYIEECKEKFQTSDERLKHCVEVHKLPKDFRFEQTHKKAKKSKQKKTDNSMDVEEASSSKVDYSKFKFTNSKQKGFSKYTGRLFTENEKGSTSSGVDMDQVMEDLKTNLPE
ncbi:zinc finger protein 511 isoform X2 [Ostrinia furnacalis]|nr:zinc finger protein 511 isoform X2 [Ostrinia furnacalis]XP_028177668.1 zinc finger protein 511 isoform X2 [Ostrinia furnacalis]